MPRLLYCGCSSNISYSPILSNCRSLLAKVPRVKVVHAFREANRRANYIARVGCSMQGDFVIFDNCPTGLYTLFNSDRDDVYYCKLVTASLVSMT